MTDMPTIKVKVTPIFPSAVTVDSPLLLDTTGGAYHFALDVDALSESIIIPLNGPSSQIGLTPVQGVSTTAMRSDSAPALDQSIAPTWSGVHTYNNAVKFVGDHPAVGPAIFNFENTLTAAGGTAGHQWNNNASNLALMNLSNAGDLTLGGTFNGAGATLSGQVRGNRPGPVWGVQTGLYDGWRVSINSYPESHENVNGNTAINAIVGAISIPNTASSGGGVGVAGYAETDSSLSGAVGLYGQGGLLSGGPDAFHPNFFFGLNTVCMNATIPPASGNGFDNFSGYGYEMDVNLRLVSGAAPKGTFRGIVLTGGCEGQPTMGFDGISIESPGVFQSPKIKWKKGLHISDGAAEIGIDLGTNNEGNTQGSQQIRFNSRDAGAVAKVAVLATDFSGNLSYIPGSSSAHYMFRGDGATLSFTVEDTETRARQTTQSTSSTSGALRSAGGLGVVKDAYIGGTVTVGVAGSTLGTLALSGLSLIHI